MAKQQQVVQNPDKTASARILTNMHSSNQPFSRYALNISKDNALHFKNRHLDVETTQQFLEMAEKSQQKLQLIEGRTQLPFDQYLQQYFAQCLT
ncbi:MAG: hypothetical protein ABL925_08800 [Methylococcales bacterium]